MSTENLIAFSPIEDAAQTLMPKPTPPTPKEARNIQALEAQVLGRPEKTKPNVIRRVTTTLRNTLLSLGQETLSLSFFILLYVFVIATIFTFSGTIIYVVLDAIWKMVKDWASGSRQEKSYLSSAIEDYQELIKSEITMAFVEKPPPPLLPEFPWRKVYNAITYSISLVPWDWITVLVTSIALVALAYLLWKNVCIMVLRNIRIKWNRNKVEIMTVDTKEAVFYPTTVSSSRKMPDCQFQLVIVDEFNTTIHQAFGIRVGNYAVFPVHALRCDQQIYMCNPNNQNKLLPMSSNYVVHEHNVDVGFFQLEEADWSKISVKGAKIAKLPTDNIPRAGFLVNMKRSTDAVLFKHSNQVSVVFKANTNPGDSGAAYVLASTGQIVGIHLGADTNSQYNIGHSMHMVHLELMHSQALKPRIATESEMTNYMTHKGQRIMDLDAEERYKGLLEQRTRAIERGDSALGIEYGMSEMQRKYPGNFDYGKQPVYPGYEYESADPIDELRNKILDLSKEQILRLIDQIRPLEEEVDEPSLNIRTQSFDEKEISIEDVIFKQGKLISEQARHSQELSKRIEDLEYNQGLLITQLEDKVDKVENNNISTQTEVCKERIEPDKKFRTLKLNKKEAAVEMNYQKPVVNFQEHPNFLGAAQLRPNRKKNLRAPNSNLWAKKKVFTTTPQKQSPMQSGIQNPDLKKALLNLVQIIDGQIRHPRQNLNR